MQYLDFSRHQIPPYATAYSIYLYVNKFVLFFLQVKSSTTNDVNLDLSPSVIKYLKENLYLRALSGHLYLKESLPVVDILPVIEEESEPVEEDDTSEWIVDGLEHIEEKIPTVIDNIKVYDVILNTSEEFIENHLLDSVEEDFEKVRTKLPNLIEKDSKSIPVEKEIVQDNDRLPIKEPKLFSLKEITTSLPFGEKSEAFVEKFSKPAETDPNFNAALKISEMHESRKENLTKIQNDSINTMEESEATRIEPLCCNDHARVKLFEEVEKRKDRFSNTVDRNHLTNTTCHANEETGPHDECYAERNVENTIESEEKLSRKTGKKKFNTFRKWLSNLCCCARKDT